MPHVGAVRLLGEWVDFHWEIDGKTYEFTLPGGGFVSFSQLAEVMGLARTEEQQAADLNWNTEDVENDAAESDVQTVEESGNASSDEQGEAEKAGSSVPLTLGNVTVSDETLSFVEDVESISFSTPELVSVSRVENDTTVGAIKESLGLAVQYSAELTEEQIEEINGTKVQAGDWALISVQPFTSEEEMTVTMKDGEVFTIHVTDAQIRKTVIDARGDAWEITVTYGEDAQIPDGAELKVREILPEDGKYEEYYEQSLDTTGVINANPEGEYAHVFDIQIWSDDHEVEPASAVTVDIRLLDTPEEEDMDLRVVHFGKDGPEMMDTGNAKETEAGQAELSFVTGEFSVYTVVDVSNSTDLVGGGPWVLVSGIAGDPGATTGYNEDWGRDYFTIIVNANAMSDEAVTNQGNNIAFAAEGVHVWTNGSQSYVGGDAPEVWIFEPVPNSNKYYIKKSGTYSYIDHHYGNSETCSLSTQWKTEFTIDRNDDGTISIRNGNWYLCNNGNGEWGSRDFRFQQNVGGQSRAKFRLCKQSDDFESFAAKKVSVQELTGNDNFLIYRKFMDEAGNEQLYALASDGTFVRVYDGGDAVYWRETDKNIYWNYLKDGTYYGIFSTDPQTGEKKYLNPMASTGATITTDPSRLTLIGKDTGEYSTAIENWDQVSYDYAGLHVTLDSQGVPSLGTGTRVAGTSDEFLFAVASSMPGSTPVPVATVDSDSLGIKITMFDYGDAKTEYSAGTKLSGMTNTVGSGSDAYTPHEAHGLVKPYLVSGLPSGNSGAMTGLFTTGGNQVTAYRENVNHLFLQSYYDENGMFRYRSEDNYAYLPFDPNGSNSSNRITSNDFIVYQQAATPYTTDTQPGHTYYYHGHFMPFNDIDTTQHVGRLMNQYGNAYTNGTVVGELPLEDGRTYEDIYGVQGIPNFFTGMKMEAKFTQPRNGQLENGDDMIFKFTGDDDMWVYIDDVLVLDIGGIHEPLSGTINFATGVVTNPAGSSLAGTTTLKQIFMNVRDAAGTPQEVKDKIDAIVWDGDTFADYTNHDFKAFYMERGAGASNMDIQFNLKVTLTNEFTVEKEIPDGVDDRFANQTYKFQATYMDGSTEKPLHAGIENICTAVVYKDTNDPVTVDENGYFYLKAGEAAVFKMADESIRYNVKEVEIDGDLIEQVDINGQQVTVTNETAEAGYAMVEDRTQVTVMNHPKTQNLLITKHLTEDSAPLVEGENPVFEFRVYLETTVTNENGTTQRQLVPYSYAPYYLVKEVDGETHYFTLTGVNNAPVDKGTTKTVCSTTGRSGSINSIPPEYTIIIPNLVVGTNFYVEERRDNIPEGYEFVKEELTEGTYDASTLITEGATSDVINRVLARDETDHQEFDPNTVGQIKEGVDAESHVYNKKPAVIITVEKEWDPEPEDGTTVTVELHRYAKITKGTIAVTLYDNNEAPIEGAVFELYKQDEDAETFTATGTEVTTNVNGIASVSGLEAGTYKLAQKSTPAGYSMDGHTTETGTLTVVDNVTTPQTLSESLTNTALVTAGKVTLNVTDSGAGSGTSGTPIEGATFTLYKDGAVYNTGYTSNSEGKVIVGNLAAGDYYFVQTGTTADYNLPNVTRTEYFTVVENPGVTQEFNQSITNSLKGKGTVSLTLSKDSGEAISGASFQLKSGSTVLETGTTDSNGRLSFSTELYEGTYTVHQVDTGSAGDEYAVIADEYIIIDDNSVTTQHISLSFENDIAAGNNTVAVYRGQGELEGYKQCNNGDTEPALVKSRLKAGETVKIKITRLPNGHTMGYCTDYVVSNSNGYGTWVKIEQWDGNDFILEYTIPAGADNQIFNIGVTSGWGKDDGSVTFIDDNILQSASVMKHQKLSANSGILLAAPLNSSGSSQTVSHISAEPASSPEGYATDVTFVETWILTAQDNWTHTFDIQDKYDADGNPYYYYIVETACSDPDYWIDSYSGDNLNDVGTIVVTNKKEKTGGLTIIKNVTVNGAAVPSDKQDVADGTYTFTITGPDGYSSSGTIIVSNGVAQSTIVLTELKEGTYTIRETGSTNENGITLAPPQTVTVTAGKQAEANVATFTNNLVTASLEIIKVEKGYKDSEHTLSGAKFQLLRVDANGNIVTGSGSYQSDIVTVDSSTGKISFTGLYPGSRYKLEEKEAPAGYILTETPWYIFVDEHGSSTLTAEYTMASAAENSNSFYIENEPGVALPSTGGSGTNRFYVIGFILIALAGMGMVMKRR